MPDVVLPCLNEAPALPWVLDRMPPGYRAIVVDNGSTDGSPDVARAHGARVIRVDQRGFGAAAHGGLLVSTDDVVCFLDADATLDPRQLPRVAGPVLDGAADLVLGRRRPVERSAWPAHARLANTAVTGLLRLRCGTRLRDLGPMRAARRAALLDLALVDRGFGYPLEMVARAARAGWTIGEVDVDYLPRANGTTSKVTGTVRGTLRAVRDMSAVLTR